MVVGFVTKTPSGGTAALNNSVIGSEDETTSISPLDTFSSADIAVHVARMTNMGEATAVANHANKINTQLPVTPVAALVAKPQIVASSIKSVKDIREYVVQEGDTLSSLSTKFGITSSSIQESNGLIGEILSPGSRLKIPPVNGIIYTVQEGDTPESLAQYYSSNAAKIIAFNNAEVDGLKVGQQIVIPGGENPAPVYSGVTYSSFRPAYGVSYTYIAHYTSYIPYPIGGYGRGWCTDWAAYRSAQLGNRVGNWGNANTWDSGASAAGYYVGPVPKVGAVLQSDYGWAGHVGVVEEVRQTDSGYEIKYSDMNGFAGWGNAAKTKNWVPAAGYDYIYR